VDSKPKNNSVFGTGTKKTKKWIEKKEAKKQGGGWECLRARRFRTTAPPFACVPAVIGALAVWKNCTHPVCVPD